MGPKRPAQWDQKPHTLHNAPGKQADLLRRHVAVEALPHPPPENVVPRVQRCVPVLVEARPPEPVEYLRVRFDPFWLAKVLHLRVG
jgi:hypothetical protein